MTRGIRLIRRYPVVALTLAIGLLGAVLAIAGAGWLVAWIFSGYALAVAVWQAIGMVRDILRGHWGLDILAVTAIVATVLVGEYVAALLVVLMLTGGEALEDYANRRAKRELDALLTRAPQLAHRMQGDEIVEVRADEVRPGDVLLVRPSEIVPVDATLRSAEAAFDESSITGESVPVEKAAGDAVLSGSVNGLGGSDTLAGSTTYVVTGANSGTATSVAGGFVGVENLVGTGGSDTFTLNGGTLSGTVDGAAGTDTLTGDNVANTWTITGPNSGTVTGTGGWQNIENLVGGTGADAFSGSGGGSVGGTIVDGGGGATTLSGTVSSGGAQTYSAAVTLGGATTIQSGGAVDFGSTVDGKLSFGFRVNEDFNLRGSTSTGFRAPSLHQRYFSSTFTDFIAGEAADVKLAPNDSELARLVGIPALKEETSQNVSLGFTWVPRGDVDVTFDVYQIDIDDRIVLTGGFTTDDPDIGEIIAAQNKAIEALDP